MIRRGTIISRALALLLAVSPLIVAMGGLAAWAGGAWVREGERLEIERAERHDLEARTTQTSLYGPVLDAWRAFAASEGSGLVRAADVDAADATLQTRISDMFDRFDGAWIGAERLPPQAGDPESILRLETRGELNERSLARFLSALETEAPYVFVEALDARRTQTDAAELNPDDARLELRLRVAAYWLAEDAL